MKLSSTFISPRPDNDEEDSSQVGLVHFVRTFGRLSNVFLRRLVGIGSDKLARPAKTPFDVPPRPSFHVVTRDSALAPLFLQLPSVPLSRKISLLLLMKRRGPRITPAIEQTIGVYLAIQARSCLFSFFFFFLSMKSRFFGWIGETSLFVDRFCAQVQVCLKRFRRHCKSILILSFNFSFLIRYFVFNIFL